MITIRINVLNTAALDSFTPLPPDAKNAVRSTGGPLQIYELTLPDGQNFGAFDPGELGLLGTTGSYLLRHCTVISKALQKSAPHNSGSVVALESPQGPGGFTNRRTIIDLSTGGPALGTGVVPEGSGIPIPVGHRILFDTDADSSLVDPPGPHLIQMTFMPAKLPNRVPGGTLRTGFPQACVPPVIDTTEPSPIFPLLADNVSTVFCQVFGSGFTASDVIKVRSIAPFPGNELTVTPTFINDTQWDLDIGPAGFGDVGTYELVIERGSNALCFDSQILMQVIPPA
jgi:hypothetical protein